MKQNKMKFPLDIQMYSSDEDAAESQTTDTTEQDVETTETETQETKSFTQDEVDKIIKGRVERARKSWEKELQDQQSEAEKLASMNEKEKKEYQTNKREEEMAKREAEITRRELTAQAKEELAEKGLPMHLADVLNYENAEKCKESIETVSNAFQEAVQKAVEDRIKGGATMKKALEGKSYTAEQIKGMSPDEINENWDAIQESLKK